MLRYLTECDIPIRFDNPFSYGSYKSYHLPKYFLVDIRSTDA